MLVRQLKEGDMYRRILPAVAIIVSKCTMLEETKRFHCEFGTLEKTEHFELHGLRAIHTLELSKLPKNVSGKLEDWLKFINSDKKEEYMAVAQKSKPMRRALKVLEEASADPRLRDDYFYRVMAAADEQARAEYRIDKAKEEWLKRGLEEGLEKGIEKGKMAIAQNMKNMGFDADTIAKSTGLTVDDVLRL
jgi:predicted transposase/invertase (TIGR01784 family)